MAIDSFFQHRQYCCDAIGLRSIDQLTDCSEINHPCCMSNRMQSSSLRWFVASGFSTLPVIRCCLRRLSGLQNALPRCRERSLSSNRLSQLPGLRANTTYPIIVPEQYSVSDINELPRSASHYYG